MQKGIFRWVSGIEHKQEMINKASTAIFMSISKMPTISCRIICRTGAECIHFVCPGGYVVKFGIGGRSIVTNGMSYSKETEKMQNSAVLVSVLPEDIEGENPLSGFIFRKSRKKRMSLEADILRHASEWGIFEKCRFGRLCRNKADNKTGVKYCRIDDIFPRFVTESLKEALPEFDKKLKALPIPTRF